MSFIGLHQLCCKLQMQMLLGWACSVHGQRITLFKFDIYLLMMTEKYFIVILGLQGHKRMGKTCAPKMLCFLRHPSIYCTLFKFNIWLGGFPGRIDALQSCSILLESGEPVLVLVDGVLYVHAPLRLLRRFSAVAAAGSTVRCAVCGVSAAAERTVQAAHRRPTRAE